MKLNNNIPREEDGGRILLCVSLSFTFEVFVYELDV